MKFSQLIRTYSNEPLTKNQIKIITGQEFSHLKFVMRVKLRQIIRIFNSSTGEYEAQITEINSQNLKLKLGKKLRIIEPGLRLTLALCKIKPTRLSEAISGAVQLGVTNFIIVNSQRSQNHPINIDKIQTWLQQSLTQSERLIMPNFQNEISFNKFCTHYQNRQIIFANEEEKNHKISKINKFSDDPIILIGPEGGFTQDEINHIMQLENSTSVSLGPAVLRSEIAAISLISRLQELR